MKKSFDSIVKKKLDLGIMGGVKVKVRVSVTHEEPGSHNFASITHIKNIYYPKLPLILTAVLMLAAFGLGMWYNMSTQESHAQQVPPIKTDTYIVPLTATSKDLSDLTSIPNDVLFNLPLGQLESYMNDLGQKQQQAKQDQILADRSAKLKNYLEQKGSPFSQYTDLIAAQPHWKLILAISYAESTLGKHCYTNNCSGIGVQPGNPFWREYDDLGGWIKDFNNLLEKRYKNWTLEQMDGVYVQPKSKNWLLAARQILTELQQQGIE